MNYKELKESLAHAAAKRLGLDYYGFGRYGRDGKVTYVSRFDRLNPITKIHPFTTLPDEKLKHLNHADDEVFNNGVDGVRNVLDHINALKHGNDRVLISQKVDGCVHADTILMTNFGKKTIKDICENNYKDMLVLAKDLDSGLDIMTSVINTTVTNGDKLWVEVLFDNGTTLKLTCDHEVYTTNRGWVEAGKLTEEDDVQII